MAEGSIGIEEEHPTQPEKRFGIPSFIDLATYPKDKPTPRFSYFLEELSSRKPYFPDFANKDILCEQHVEASGVLFSDDHVAYSADTPRHQELAHAEKKPLDTLVAYFKFIHTGSKPPVTSQDQSGDKSSIGALTVFSRDFKKARDLVNFLTQRGMPNSLSVQINLQDSLLMPDYSFMKTVFNGDLQMYQFIERKRRLQEKRLANSSRSN